MKDERIFSLEYIKGNNLPTKDRDIYEFGLYRGNSMIRIHKKLKKLKLEVHKIYGFDSFTGLPSEAEEVPIHKSWQPGKFNAMAYFKKNSIKDVIIRLKNRLTYNNLIGIKIIPGFFGDVLNKKLVEKYEFKPACFVEVDVDLYISAYQVLDFLAKNKLIIKDTIIAYNDWGGIEEFKGGESKAHKEIIKKYNIVAKEIFSGSTGQKAFIIEKI